MKEDIRKRIWQEMEKKDVTRFPKPVDGRIPNFVGAEKAAERLTKIKEFRKSRVVKVNPDSPQHPVRQKVIEMNKILYMPTPRLKKGFVKIDPQNVPSGLEEKATTIKHFNKFGENIDLEEMEEIDFVIAGSVAVTRNGRRVGKGGGYSDLEYAILKELGLGKPPIATTVHPIQILKNIPTDEHDITLDWVITPSETIKTNTDMKKPEGIDWMILPEDKYNEIPLLRDLKNRS